MRDDFRAGDAVMVEIRGGRKDVSEAA